MAVNQYSLTTLDNVKNFMGKAGNSTAVEDDLLENLINRVSTLFESDMDRKILTREHTEYHDGKGLSVLFPKQYPITVVTSIHDDYDWEWETADLIDADDYRIVDDNYIVLKNTTFNDYKQNIKLIYTAGYSTVPGDLEQQAITEISRMFSHRLEVDITAQALGDGSISFSDKGFLPLTVKVLNKYKKLGIV